MTELKKAALNYASKGFKVFPLTPLSKIPLKGTRGSKEATTDTQLVEKWWTNEPQANIGLVTDTFIVLDIDRHNEGVDGFKSLETLCNTFEPLPDTTVVKTANNGAHCYFMKPKGIELPQKIALMKGLDIKAHPNNYILAPPSRVKRTDGTIGIYKPENKIKMAKCPQWLIDFILRDEPKQKQAFTNDYGRSNRYRNKTTDLLERLVTGAVTGARNDTIARTTGQLLTYGVSVPISWALIQFMNNNSDEPLEQKELETTFLSICKRELNAN